MRVKKIETVAEFLLRGGKIQMIDRGKSGMDLSTPRPKNIALGAISLSRHKKDKDIK